ncbi:hypothetical protein H9650_14225 [Psychrobacillus sp. Sa2BUA9]|uniref:Uncharacterized protein n=1 Tax=Psychrobacillus faecigallinarum TaxID=2762235 RepID=A0ABR8RBV6_9BACI|nr:hypothetical protein [Psychrobacillus faecigallinarum]MBD7945279.1 hypothetical protein [Psychrobacillus faecigallinarum]
MEEVHQSRAIKVLQVAVLYAEVEKRKGKVSKTFKNKLEATLPSLAAMLDDEYLWQLAQKTIEAVHHALNYIESGDDYDLQQMIKAHDEGDKICYEVMERRNTNGN